MNKRYLVFWSTLILTLTVVPTGLLAQERYDDATLTELQRFNFDIGVFLIGNYNTKVRFDSNTVPIGTVIDFEDQLDVNRSYTTGRIDGFYRFNKRHRLDWTYYGSRREGDSTVTEDITIGDPDDPDGECTIGAGARVQSKLDFDLLKLGYSYSFLNTRKYELLLGGGLNVRNYDIGLDAQGALVGCEDDGEGGGTRVTSDGLMPLPSINFGGRWNWTPKLQARWQWQVFALQFGEYKGSTKDTSVLIEHRTFKHVGFGAGINSFDLRVESEGTDLNGEITTEYLGLLGYVKVYF